MAFYGSPQATALPAQSSNGSRMQHQPSTGRSSVNITSPPVHAAAETVKGEMSDKKDSAPADVVGVPDVKYVKIPSAPNAEGKGKQSGYVSVQDPDEFPSEFGHYADMLRIVYKGKALKPTGRIKDFTEDITPWTQEDLESHTREILEAHVDPNPAWLYDSNLVKVIMVGPKEDSTYFIHKRVAKLLFAHKDWKDEAQASTVRIETSSDTSFNAFPLLINCLYAAANYSRWSQVPIDILPVPEDENPHDLYAVACYFKIQAIKDHALSQINTDVSLERFIKGCRNILQSRMYDQQYDNFFKIAFITIVKDTLSGKYDIPGPDGSRKASEKVVPIFACIFGCWHDREVASSAASAMLLKLMGFWDEERSMDEKTSCRCDEVEHLNEAIPCSSFVSQKNKQTETHYTHDHSFDETEDRNGECFNVSEADEPSERKKNLSLYPGTSPPSVENPKDH